MNHWRMSFRCGPQGEQVWRHCRKHGVAAISDKDGILDDVDLSQHAYGEPPDKWRQLNSTQKASIRRLAHEMRKGDIIYVKEGPSIVGRGAVLGPYAYRLKAELQKDIGYDWPHQVPVAWEADFAPIRVLLGAERITVLKLTDEHLRQLGEGDDQSPQPAEVTEAEEGQIVQASVRFRQRNRALVDAKRAQCAQPMRCELCGFSFRNRYGPTVKEVLEVHHCNPVAEMEGVVVTTIDDLVLLCPNCHRALHSTKPAMTVARLKNMIR
ncbi:MAG: HNH endonuclease [Armatimonadetes bacterium]|nr:HNH endonuclease [Armatimonadota bacterium]